MLECSASRSGAIGGARFRAIQIELQTALGRCVAGSVGPAFAILLTLLVLAAGAVIDVGRWAHASSRAQKALAAAALAGGRMLQINRSDHAQAMASARHAFELNLGNDTAFVLERLSLAVAADGVTFTIAAQGFTPTTLLRIAGLDSLTLRFPEFSASGGKGAGGDASSRIEVALAIDVSDSIAGPIIDHLRAALTDLVDIVVTPDEGGPRRVALVPFADAINPGIDLDRLSGALRPGVCAQPGCQHFTFIERGQVRTFASGHCVSARTVLESFTDAAPPFAPLPVAYRDAAGRCPPAGPVQPLSSEPEPLRRAIAAILPGGSSAPQIGIAWAWYALSPEWEGMWPAASRPAPYADAEIRGASGRPELRKIAVLVQSARDTVQHCQGVDDSVIACPSPAGSALQQTRLMCQAMRRRGIAIYVVGIGIDSNREMDDVLRDACAGRESSYYAVRTGGELRQALRDIALQIAPLVETH